MDVFALARSIQKHVARLKSVGYSHPPVHGVGRDEGVFAAFTVSDNEGDKVEVIVRELTTDEELERVRSFKEQVKNAFLAGWWVNAATPGEEGTGDKAYFDGAAEADWQEFWKKGATR
jgi:hypothetical protein